LRHPSFTWQYRHFYRVERGLEPPRLGMEAEEAIVSAPRAMGEGLGIHG